MLWTGVVTRRYLGHWFCADSPAPSAGRLRTITSTADPSPCGGMGASSNCTPTAASPRYAATRMLDICIIRQHTRTAARRAYLTHIAHDIRHAELEPKLPMGVHLAYDGLVVDLHEATPGPDGRPI